MASRAARTASPISCSCHTVNDGVEVVDHERELVGGLAPVRRAEAGAELRRGEQQLEHAVRVLAEPEHAVARADAESPQRVRDAGGRARRARAYVRRTSPSTTAVRVGQLRRCSRSTSARLSPCNASIAACHGVAQSVLGGRTLMTRVKVDVQTGSPRLGVDPHGLGHVELELPAVRAFLLVDVGHRRRRPRARRRRVGSGGTRSPARRGGSPGPCPAASRSGARRRRPGRASPRTASRTGTSAGPARRRRRRPGRRRGAPARTRAPGRARCGPSACRSAWPLSSVSATVPPG